MSHPIRLFFVWLLLVSSTAILLASGIEFHVSPRGNDRNPGTIARPFRSLERAQRAVRELRKSQPTLQDTLTVLLHGGRYTIADPLMFGPDDGGTVQSPTVYAAYQDELPVMSGGMVVTGWREGMFDGKHAWLATVPLVHGKQPATVHQMWIDGQRRSAARMPNSGYFQVHAIPDITPQTEWLDGQTSFVASPGDLPAALNISGAEAVVMNRWVESRLPLTAYDGGRNLLSFSRRSVFRLDPGDPYYLLNIRAGLDTAGEWYYDAARRTIVYLPMKGEKRRSIDAVIPLLTQLVRVDGVSEKGRWVEHLIFRGITFSHNEWFFPAGFKSDSRNSDAGGFVQAATGVPAAIEFSGTRKSALEQCTIDHVGTYAVAFGPACTDNRVLRCDLHDLGGGGIKIGMKTIARDSLESTSGNLVADCNIGDGGKIFHSAIGVWIAQSPRNRLIHNQIHDFSYTGISIGWTWGYGPADAGGNVVELNHIHHIGQLSDGGAPALSDMGGIYTLGTQHGTVIRRNVFHDIGARVYGGWGIYFDEGSTGILSEQNLVYRTTHGGFHQHYGKENIVRNSIFAFGRDQQIQRTRAENHTSFAFEHNIVLWKGGRFIFGNIRDGDMVLDRNCYWPEDGRFQADSLTFQQWQALGYDHHSIVADPLFVSADKDDYSLRPGSPAFALGFVPTDFRPVYNEHPVWNGEPPRIQTSDKHRLLYNNDGSNILMAFDSLTPKLAYTRIDPLVGTGITTFLHNVNPGQNMGYPSTVANMYHWAVPPADMKEGWNLLGRHMSDNLARLVKEGIDPVGLVADRARLRGFETFLSFRMNELHDVDKPGSPLLSEFWKTHPEFRVGGYEGWGKEALNYAIPTVREYVFAILREVVSRYDLDGLELDFMRFPYYFPYRPDSMQTYAGIMTDFVARVRRMTDSTATTRGKQILLAVRVPSSLKGCAHVGLDPAAWCKSGLIDFLTVAPFLSTETDIPVEEFKAVCGVVPVYAGMEFTIGARQMTREEKRAAAALLYANGADGLYLFNYFVAWDAGLEADTRVLTELAHPDSLTKKDKLYTIAIPRYPVPGVSLPGQLPLRLEPGTGKSVMVKTHEQSLPRSVVVRLECSEDIAADDLRLTFNGELQSEGKNPMQPQVFPEKVWGPVPATSKTLEFMIDPAKLRPVNTLALQAHRPVSLEWVYLGVKY